MNPAILRLKRNDLEGALKLWLSGTCSPDDVRTLLLLQDDSGAELRRRYAAATKTRVSERR